MAMLEGVSGRNRRILAVILALVAALFLCVLGAAAAGLELSSPLFESIIGQETISFRFGAGADADASANGSGNGSGGAAGEGSALVDTLADGEGEDGEAAADNGGAAQSDAAASGAGGAAPARGGESTQRCFLNLICFRFRASVNGETGGSSEGLLLDLDADADAEAAEGGIAVFGSVDADAAAQEDGEVNSFTLLGIDLSAIFGER